MEIEAKFRVSLPFDPATIDALDLSPYALSAGRSAPHEDVALDTADRLITGGGHALRIRKEGDRSLATLKGPGKVSGGTHQREEVEVVLETGVSGPPYVPSHWPEPLGDLVSKIIGHETVEPLTHSQMDRRTWDVSLGGDVVAELALDRGYVEAQHLREVVSELEIELKGKGSQRDLDALGALLAKQLLLEAESRTKLSRGLALLAAEAPHPDVLLVDLLAHMTAHQLKRVKHLDHDGLTIDEVHDARVSLRRIRTALELVVGVIPQRLDELLDLRKGLRPLARALGPVRDLDVAMEHLRHYQSDHAAPTLRVIEQLAKRREAGEAHIGTVMGQPKTSRALKRTRDLYDGERTLEGLKASASAGTIIWAAYEGLLSGNVSGAHDESHAARIACRRLRYALELFQPALGSGVTPLLKKLVKLQDRLGDVQDHVTLLGLLAGEASEGGREDHGLREAVREGLKQSQERVPDAWRAVAGSSFRKQLATLLGAL